MRWAFWRRTTSQPTREQPAAELPVAATSCWPAPSADDPEDTPRRAAFSGAQPSAPAELVPGTPRSPLEKSPPAALAGPARSTVAELVRAVAARETAAVTDLLGRRDDGELGAASVLALAALGPRLATLAGHDGEEVPPGSATWKESVLQGDVTADRAEVLRRTTARHLPDDLLRFAVRFACGTPEADPALAHHAGASSADLLLAAAVVLAQTAEDGAGSVEALVGELQSLAGEP